MNIFRVPGLLLVMLCVTCAAYSQSAKDVEARIQRDFTRMARLRDKPSKKVTDTMEMINHKLVRYLEKACLNNPGLLKADLKNIAEEQMNIQTSEDGVVRIYNWDTQTGGATAYYDALIQYKIDDSTTGVTVLNDVSTQHGAGEPNTGAWYSRICTVQRRHNSTAYLLLSTAMYTPHSKESFLDAYTIQYRRLVPTHIFINKSKYLTSLSVAWQGSEFNPEIRVTADKKSIFVPVVDNFRQTVSDKYQLYLFDGRDYVCE